MSRKKLLNLALIISSLFGYLEWSGGNAAFLYQMEFEVLSKLFADPTSVLHPFTLVPLGGQLLLLTTLFQRVPGRWLTALGVVCLGLLLGLMLFIGLLESRLSILSSTLPFWATVFFTAREHRRLPAKQPG